MGVTRLSRMPWSPESSPKEDQVWREKFTLISNEKLSASEFHDGWTDIDEAGTAWRPSA